jgi:thiamine pyrophosphate-dependent acetolactate synthase large subunit-like protein
MFCGAGVEGAHTEVMQLAAKLHSPIGHYPARRGRRTPLKLAVHGSVAATLRAVLPLIWQKTDRSFLDRMLHEQARKLEHVVDA